MGVYKWYSYFSQQEVFRQTLLRYAPSNVNIFAIDLNSIIHTNAQKVFGYGKTKKTDTELGLVLVNGILVQSQERYDELEQELFKSIFDEIVELTKTVAPSETLIIAVDGTATQAKINQQRNRRYKSASDPGKSKVFDSNCITPGTEFMFRLDTYIQETLDELIEYDEMAETERQDPENELIASYAKGLPTRIIYSSHMCPGEGEHRIAEELRKIPSSGKNVVIHGSDSDLFMIYLTQLKNGWNNIYLFRNHFDNYKVDVMIDLKKLEEVLKQLYPQSISPADDFVVLMYLSGNDFLPSFPSFERIHDALKTIIIGYRIFLAENPTLAITDGSAVKWKNFGKFLEFIITNWESTLLSKWALNSDGMVRTAFSGLVTDSIQTISQVTHGHSHLVRKFDVPLFKSNWYSFVFSPKVGNIRLKPTPIDISTMVEKYLEGIAWVYNYYRYGVVNLNVDWYYPYYYAPLLEDIAKHIAASETVTWLKTPIYTTSSFINTLVQLVLVLPPSSVSLVPAKLRVLYTENSFIMDMFCEKAFYDSRGKIEEYQGFLILPPVNSNRVLRLFPLLGITEEEFALYSASEVIEVHRNITGSQQIETVQPRIWRNNVPRGSSDGKERGGRGRGGSDRGGQRGRGSQRARGRERGMFRGAALAPLTLRSASSTEFIPSNSQTSQIASNTQNSQIQTVTLPASLGGTTVNLIPLPSREQPNSILGPNPIYTNSLSPSLTLPTTTFASRGGFDRGEQSSRGQNSQRGSRGSSNRGNRGRGGESRGRGQRGGRGRES